MKVELKNVQSIKHALYEIPDTGIIQIAGGNSNGKSILFKAIGAVVNQTMENNAKRKSLIQRHCDDAEIIMQHKNKVLYTYLHMDRNKCYVAYQEEGSKPIIRTFRDKGIDKLVRSFGFYCYGKSSVCLQLYETFGPMPFVNVTDEINGEIVESVTEDQVAKKFLESYKNFTYPKAIGYKKELDKKIDSLIQLKASIVMYDWRKYEEFGNKMREFYQVLKFATTAQLTRVHVPPDITLYEVEPMKLKHVNVLPSGVVYDVEPVRLRKPKVVHEPVNCMLIKPTQLVYEMTKLYEGVCPTCGRPLIDKE